MKEFTSKTIEEALEQASAELGIPADKINYRTVEEKKGLFSKKVTIGVFDIEGAAEFAEEYLISAIGGLGIEIIAQSRVEDDIIHVSIDSPRNPVLIGKGGKTLQALNELTRLAVSSRFQKRFRILLDVGGYKDEKYSKITRIAKRTARDVVLNHMDAKLDPMTPDERRVVHNALSGIEHIATESTGEGSERAITIKYVE